MADGTAPTSAYESFGDFLDFPSQPKDWQQPFDLDLTLRADGLYIPPERSQNDQYERTMEHPEAVDDDDDEDDDMYDFDLPAGTSYVSESAPPQFLYSAQGSHFNNEDLSLADGYDVYRAPNSQFASPDTFYPFPHRAPVDYIAPLDLQISRDTLQMPFDDVPSFEPANSLEYDSMDVTPELVTDDFSSNGTPDQFDFDMDLDLESSQPQQEQLHNAVSPREVKSHAEVDHIDHASPEPVAVPQIIPARPAAPTTTSTKRKKVAHGPHRCDMALPNGDSCNKAFTRPYDLARHQETIHAQVRKMFTCAECGDKSKTFSRMDALSRHIRIKHSRKD